MQSNEIQADDPGATAGPVVNVVKDKPKEVAASNDESKPSGNSPSDLTAATDSCLSSPDSSDLAQTACAANDSAGSPGVDNPAKRVAPGTTVDSVVPLDPVTLAIWKQHLEKDDDDDCGCESEFGRDDDGEVRHYGEDCLN
ncbi:hypothetical protein FPV67DRAFT_1449537 [Lyophyllum atratum]|nr:hypothetical protein FPV67DRAFT_1452735 [Lyophyllum atratum]KAF8067958.1 hypothetical protein FPV67DRAFT_1449537 [Lyophyllum atratum]